MASLPHLPTTSAHPQPRVTVHLHHFLSTHIPIPHIREVMQPLPIPTHGDALEPFLIPTILPSYMLVHTNHPSFSTLSFTTIRHLYLPTCTRAPSYIQYIPCGPHPSLYKPWPNSTAITHPQPKGSSGAIAHPPLHNHSTHCPSPTSGEPLDPFPIPTHPLQPKTTMGN